jgi:hypothetical protein
MKATCVAVSEVQGSRRDEKTGRSKQRPYPHVKRGAVGAGLRPPYGCAEGGQFANQIYEGLDSARYCVAPSGRML